MIRERRSKEKLNAYYNKFIDFGVMDPNVHPWVAQSWQESRTLGVLPDRMPKLVQWSREELAEKQSFHAAAIEYVTDFYQNIHEFFSSYNMSLLLLDADCYVLKSYSLPFYQRTPGQTEGARLSMKDIGTSSISLTHRHKVPFLLFGPEMWIRECQMGDACSVPIMVDGKLGYILTLVAVEQNALPYTALVSLMLSMRMSMERHLEMIQTLKARQAILDAAPIAVYHILPNGEIAYTNKMGRSRLALIHTDNDSLPNLNDAVLNYHHTPIYQGFKGIPCYNKEITWITEKRTYEDITTVVPLEGQSGGDISGVVTVTMPIEDLRMLVAHAVGYTAKYSLASMVGSSQVFTAMWDKASRVAKNENHVLVQGEGGTGKQRLAHGIHQASTRAAGPLITLRCGDLPQEILEEELFGTAEREDVGRPGKLELANGGTLFMDEIEKLPRSVAVMLAEALTSHTMRRMGDRVNRTINVRIVAASDCDLKRLTERGGFDESLYRIVSKNTLRVPPLRARVSDIPSLAAHIIRELAQQHTMAEKTLAEDTKKLLMSYEWPGNVKQLQEVVEHAYFNTAGAVIQPEDINLMGDVKPDMSWKEDRDVFERVWKAAGGNVSRMANMLDVSRVTLYRYLKKYGIEKK